MLSMLAQKLFGSANARFLRRLEKSVAEINALEPEIEKLSDDEVRARTDWLRQRHADGEELDDLLVDSFATVREAAKRTLGQRPFDVQLMGGMVLHDGMISEMKTGEGKTLVATLPVYLNALGRKGVHVVTVNDYLANRDAEWMGQIYTFLGLTVGCIVHGLEDGERAAQYAADVTYGTNNEFGFDYLRDNMKFSLDDMVQREFNFGIVDEVDSILVDEARTPLIISGPTDDSSELYRSADKLIPMLDASDYEKDEKQRSATFTETGTEKMEQLLRDAGLLTTGGLYDIANVSLVHHVNSALKAHVLFQRDTDYIVHDGKVVIIDEFTGRMMEGRRYSEGLHQALEAKEGVEVENENQTLASITFQNYFRLYPKLAGMTGTAMTEAAEFADIYGLDVVEIPTNETCIREDFDDEVYRTANEKHGAIIMLIEECRQRKQPALVGTVSIEKSELLSSLLKKRNIPHNVLNARYHQQEAVIIAQAGQPGMVTIATNMAGRGTDIQLGGNLDMRIATELAAIKSEDERDKRTQEIKDRIGKDIAVAKEAVIQSGGLYIIGTERHEARRIDNQLRGRSGRQGDPGSSKFFLSLEDDLMRIFGSERIDGMLQKLGLEEGEAIVHRWINKALEKAQKKVEERNYDIRKNLLKFDDVMNDQRKVIYEQRKDLMTAEEVTATVTDMRHEVVEDMVSRCIPPKAYAEQWDAAALQEEALRVLAIDMPVEEWAKEEGIADEEILERLISASDRKIAEKAANYGPEVLRLAEKSLLLQILDQIWKEHLLSLDHLRQGIGLRAYAQKDPLNEYKREAFDMFEEMLASLRESVVSVLSHLEISFGDEDEDALFAQQVEGEMHETHEDPAFAHAAANGGGVLHPAAEAAVQLVRHTAAFPASVDPAEVPPGWRLHEPLGRWIDPDDTSSWGKVPRNAACPCGTGRKFKHCHGKAA